MHLAINELALFYLPFALIITCHVYEIFVL